MSECHAGQARKPALWGFAAHLVSCSARPALSRGEKEKDIDKPPQQIEPSMIQSTTKCLSAFCWPQAGHAQQSTGKAQSQVLQNV